MTDAAHDVQPVGDLIVQVHVAEDAITTVVLVIFVTNEVWIIPVNRNEVVWIGPVPGDVAAAAEISVFQIVDVYIRLPPLAEVGHYVFVVVTGTISSFTIYIGEVEGDARCEAIGD